MRTNNPLSRATASKATASRYYTHHVSAVVAAASAGTIIAGISAATTVAGTAYGLASGGGGGGGGGSAGYQASQASLAAAGKQFSDLQTPDLNDLQIRLRQAVFKGDLTSVQAVAMLQRASALEGVTADPRAIYAQMRAVEGLSKTVDMKGMTSEDKAQLFSAMSDQGTDISGARGRREQGLAERGLADQESQELERDIAGQAGANRGAKVAVQSAADAQGRLEQATAERGRLATEERDRAFQRQSRIAQANDQINQANAARQNQFAQFNAQGQRDVRNYGADTRQTLSDINTGITNEQQTANARAAQQDFDNRLARARGQAGAFGTAANLAGAQAAQLGNQPSPALGIISTVGTLASAGSKFIK